MKVIGIVTSPRCGKVSKERFNKIIDSDDIMNSIYEIGYEGKVSNSECLLLAAMWGAYKEGADVEIIYKDDPVPDFDGVVLSSPVYFGDRSSGLYDFILSTNLKGKAVGVVSSGAKRNGGQETTNIYALYDCLDKGSLITGNGPPTAQYGGTGWGGNKTAIVNDDFGIKTSYGTGKHVCKLSRLVTSKEAERKSNILFLCMTTDWTMIDEIKDLQKKFKNSNVEILDISKMKIKKCVGCPVCPNGDLSKEYKCIQQDDMKIIREYMIKADCIIYATGIHNEIFQRFIERTRFIRRTHFELAERVYSSFHKTYSITDILPLRVMTNMLRQNMFGLPFYHRFSTTFSNINMDEYIDIIEKYTKKSITMREISGIDYEYTAVGYEDAKIDEKAYRD